MRFKIAVIILALTPVAVSAFSVDRIDIRREAELVELKDISISQMYYGSLSGVPHTYTFTLTEPTIFRAALFVPDIAKQQNNIQAILVKEVERGVETVDRLRSSEADWEPRRRGATGDIDRVGPSYEAELGVGTYIFEVNTPDNSGSYVLEIGPETTGVTSYLIQLRTLIDLKRLHHESPLLIVEAPVVLVPTLFVGMVGIYWYRKRRGHDRVHV